MLADSPAVAVLGLTPGLGRAFHVTSGRELDRFFKRKFLFGAVEVAARFIALIIDGAPQISFALPAVSRHAVLQQDRLDPAFYDLKHRRQVIRDQDLGLHGEFQPRFPSASIRRNGVLEHLQFHV